ncbi:hypothetical protein KY290_023106 [Solanum tuberosum]|uniref:Uncharacterized protein n=1 Tax=Solanum tuberosum TaxID=4113 RepID=A0ABQ7V7C9_SOLTU|nr:hypothetical protein KY284_022027 [Solanum tuberosum]KAH0684383.1 hypothetical protein KY289_022135 [Solanum tuberosum]KAH0694799.1 hypothetical protein KY285_021896 [Solanum tuberosum]KAH0759613.1 hypothetical protein KY290_023106 [Solanum tuberosum]
MFLKVEWKELAEASRTMGYAELPEMKWKENKVSSRHIRKRWCVGYRRKVLIEESIEKWVIHY